MRQRNVPSCSSDRGFTLIEVMVAAAVLMVGVLGTMVMIDGANQVQRDNNTRTAASALSRDILERARAVEYESIAETSTSPDPLLTALRAKTSLEGRIENGKWIINRRGVDFVVRANPCTYDDPSDGVATPGPADPCDAGTGAPTGMTDTNPDDFRRVVLTLQWTRGGKTRQLVHTTQIVNPGGGLGPRITNFPNANSGNQIPVGSTLTSVALNAESTVAWSVRWAVDDGRSSGLANLTEAGGKKWDWAWPIGTVDSGTPGVHWALDGSYAANAQAFDSRGVPGELRVANIVLNRRIPLAPRIVGGGRSHGTNGSVKVEMDWLPNAERDIIGYRVYRLAADNATREAQICPAATTGDNVTKNLFCTDTAPPGETTRPNVRYVVVAVDRPTLGDMTSGTREGDARSVDVGPTGDRLDRPTLTVTTDNGRPKLNWTVPANLDAGERILFYRIYRDDVRYARTVSDATTYTDPAPTATSHRYRVSAVHESYNEGHLSDEKAWP